VINTSMSASI